MGKQRVELRNVRTPDDRSSAASRPSVKDKASKQSSKLKKLPLKPFESVQVLKRYPLAILFGAWAVLMFSGGFAVTVLLTPGVLTEASEPEAVASPVPTVREFEQSDDESLPLLTYGTIAFSCAMGCLILARLLNMTAPRPVQRLEDASAKSAAPRPLSSSSEAAVLTESATQAIVSVVPGDQSQPLDWDEPSLADSLDLRQRRPLSYWL